MDNSEMNQCHSPAFINDRGRIECHGTEFSSGNVVEVLIDGTWKLTRIEFDFEHKRYYSVDALPLVGNQVRSA